MLVLVTYWQQDVCSLVKEGRKPHTLGMVWHIPLFKNTLLGQSVIIGDSYLHEWVARFFTVMNNYNKLYIAFSHFRTEWLGETPERVLLFLCFLSSCLFKAFSVTPLYIIDATRVGIVLLPQAHLIKKNIIVHEIFFSQVSFCPVFKFRQIYSFHIWWCPLITQNCDFFFCLLKLLCIHCFPVVSSTKWE